MEVIIYSCTIAFLVQKPQRVELKHFGVFQSSYTGRDAGQGNLANLLPESYFCILLHRHSDEEALELRGQSYFHCYKRSGGLVLLLTSVTAVNLDTRICHTTNDLGRLVVTLEKAIEPHVMPQAECRSEGEAQFFFDLREGRSFSPHQTVSES